MRRIAGERTLDIKRELIRSAEEDYLDLASVAGMVEEAFGLNHERKVFLYTTSTLSDLHHHGFLRAGIPTADGGFRPWDRGPKDALSLIEHEWSALHRRPALGEIVWFDATDRGITYLGSTAG